MSKAYESIRQGLTEAIGHAKGERKVVKVGRPAPGARRSTLDAQRSTHDARRTAHGARRPLTWRPCEA